jgi:hypothetical protein
MVEGRIASAALRGLTTMKNSAMQQRTAMKRGYALGGGAALPESRWPTRLCRSRQYLTISRFSESTQERRIVTHIQHREHTRPHPCPPRLIACGATHTTPTRHSLFIYTAWLAATTVVSYRPAGEQQLPDHPVPCHDRMGSGTRLRYRLPVCGQHSVSDVVPIMV